MAKKFPGPSGPGKGSGLWQGVAEFAVHQEADLLHRLQGEQGGLHRVQGGEQVGLGEFQQQEGGEVDVAHLVLLPEGAEQFRNVLDSPALGKEGTIYPVKNGHYDFTKVPGAESRSMVKYYVESRISEGYCGFYYPVADISYILQYDGSKLPYLGVWITAGGFQGDYNCALEPTNGFYDSIGRAAENRRLPVLAAGEILEFELSVTLAEGNARR